MYARLLCRMSKFMFGSLRNKRACIAGSSCRIFICRCKTWCSYAIETRPLLDLNHFCSLQLKLELVSACIQHIWYPLFCHFFTFLLTFWLISYDRGSVHMTIGSTVRKTIPRHKPNFECKCREPPTSTYITNQSNISIKMIKICGQISLPKVDFTSTSRHRFSFFLQAHQIKIQFFPSIVLLISFFVTQNLLLNKIHHKKKIYIVIDLKV